VDGAPEAESGQALVEFALILIIMLTLIIGTVDVGRGFYQYNALASSARYAARWGSVVGGTCNGNTDGQIAPSTANDWCNQNNFSAPPPVSGACVTPDSTMGGFWKYNGNYPLQCGGPNGAGNCPATYNPSFAGYYHVSDFVGSNDTSIVGAVASRFDTNSSGPYNGGTRTATFDPSQLLVCIQLPWDADISHWQGRIGDPVRVFVYFTFHPATTWLAKVDFHLVASSSYSIE
jgi:TadE-like protein